MIFEKLKWRLFSSNEKFHAEKHYSVVKIDFKICLFDKHYIKFSLRQYDVTIMWVYTSSLVYTAFSDRTCKIILIWKN